VVAADVAADGLDKTRARAAEIGAGERLTTLEMNVGDERSVVDGVRSAVDTLGGLDSLVNAAGILRAAHTEQMGLDLWNQIIGVNLTGTFLVVREALPTLLQNPRSAIVNFSSTSASFAHPYMAAYAASKGGLVALTHALAISLAPEVRVNCISPGWIVVRREEERKLRRKDHLQHPAGRVGRPEDIAEMVAFLLDRDRAGFVTGANFVVDGGMTRKMIYEE